ncbi:MAG: FHA domain-containing protein [Sedimenticolaceae bacterium]
MAALIIELPGRGGSEFHKIKKAVTRVGRALDNDIILSDPSVSPYHFTICRNPDGAYELHPLADENGIRIGRRKIEEPLALSKLPLAFDAGRTAVRILDSAQPVPPTRLISCQDGGACLFGHWGWALLLFCLFFVLSAIDNYLSTPKLITWESFGRDQMNITLVALGLSFVLLAINRLTSQRWDYSSSLSFTSLALISALLLDQLVPFLDYVFTSPLPGFVIDLIWIVILLPLAMAWFLVRLHHGNSAASVFFILFSLTPIAYLQLKEIADEYDLFQTFSKKAFYSDALYPSDRRLSPTISIDEFAKLSAQSVAPEPNRK